MAKIRKGQSIDAGKIEGPIVAPNEEVQRDFEEAARSTRLGRTAAHDRLSYASITRLRLSYQAATLTQLGKIPMWARRVWAAKIQLLIRTLWKSMVKR
jgi:hypothetical protein